MKRLLPLVFIVLMIGLAILLFAYNYPAPVSQADAQTMRLANQLYEGGQYAQAAQMLEQLAERGIANPTLFYNLGTAYLQQGDTGRAILYLYRARQLAPRDADIASNLEIARSRVPEPSSIIVRETPLEQAVSLLESAFTLNEMAVLALGLWIGFAVLLLASWRLKSGFVRPVLRAALVVVAVLAVVSVAAFALRAYADAARTPAVVVANQASLSANPGESGTGLVLASGEEVDVLAERGDWVQVLLPDGRATGWVARSTIAIL